MGKHSLVWNFFDKEGPKLGKCNTCGKIVKLTDFSTTPLRSHLRNHHLVVFMELTKLENSRRTALLSDSSDDDDDDPQPGPSRDRGRGDPAGTPKGRKRPAAPLSASKAAKIPKRAEWPKDHPRNERLVTEITKLIVERDLPFSLVDSPQFIRAFKEASDGQYNPVSRHTFSRSLVPKMYKFMRGKVSSIIEKDKLNLDGVSFTTDIWTSDNNQAFQSLTCHYIDKRFNMKRFLVRLEAFPESHTGANIAAKLDLLIEGLNLGPRVSTWCTSDGGSNVRSALVKSNQIHTGLWCVDHQIHLMITDAFKKCEEWAELSRKLSTLVGYFSHSAKATMVLRKIAEEMGCNRTTLVQKVVTRWNSDLRQLQSILDLWEPLMKMAETDATVDGYMPTVVDKLNLGSMVNLLSGFAKFSELASSDKGPTLNCVIPQIYVMTQVVTNLSSNPPHTLIGQVAGFLRDEIKRRFVEGGTKVLEYCLAEFLDPSLKGSILRMFPNDLFNQTKETVIQALLDLSRGDVEGEAQASPTPSPDEDEELDPIEAACRAAYGPHPTRAAPLSTSLLASTCEVEVYLKEPLKPRGVDILGYWNENRDKLPGLGRLARKILAIPASSATSERVFSTAGNICVPRRTSLSVANIEMLVYMKENMREFNKLDIVWPGF